MTNVLLVVLIALLGGREAPSFSNHQGNRPSSDSNQRIAELGDWSAGMKRHGTAIGYRDLVIDSDGAVVVYAHDPRAAVTALERKSWARDLRIRGAKTAISFQRGERILRRISTREAEIERAAGVLVVTMNVLVERDAIRIGIVPYSDALAAVVQRQLRPVAEGLPIEVVRQGPILRH